MIDQITALESCWYLSEPWGKKIPSLAVNLLERVYLPHRNLIGYCCGVEWLQQEWSYAVALDNKVIYATEHQMIPTGRLQSLQIDKPVFKLGEKVLFCCQRDIPKLRIVQGINLIEDFWTYTVEWVSPSLNECDGKLITSGDRRAWVTDTDLVRA